MVHPLHPLLIHHLLPEHCAGTRASKGPEQSVKDTVVPALEESAERQCTEHMCSVIPGLCLVMATMAPRHICATPPPAIGLISCFPLGMSVSLSTHDTRTSRNLHCQFYPPYTFLLCHRGYRGLRCPWSLWQWEKSRAWSLAKGDPLPVGHLTHLCVTSLSTDFVSSVSCSHGWYVMEASKQ